MTTPARRSGDGPMWPRLTLAFAVFVAGVALRALDLLGETGLVILVFAAGVLVKDESVLGLARIWRRPPPAP